MGEHPVSDGSALGTPPPALKIGLLTGDLSHRHGWAHHSLSLIEALLDADAALTVVAAGNSPDVPGVTLHKLLPAVVPAERFSLIRQAAALPKVRALLRGCDVIHTTVEPYAPLAAWVAGDRPLLVTAHGSYVRLPELRRWPASAIYHRALGRSTLVCVSRYTARVAAAVIPGVRTVVVNNGVDADRFFALASTRRERESAPTVLAVGAVKPRKGIVHLVRAMAAVRRQHPDARCVVIGSLDDAAYVERVRAEIHALGLDDRVRLLGHVPEEALLGWYAAADVFALPAINEGERFEGYGLVYLEAGAAGLPVIGTTDTGTADAVDDGVTGLLVSQEGVADELPRAINRLLSDPELAARMGAAGRARARAQTWARVAAQMLALYTEAARDHA